MTNEKQRSWSPETEFFLCECETPDHQMLMRLYDWGADSPKSLSMPPSSNVDLTIDIHLHTNKGFFKRLWYGLGYIFGRKSRYGAFEGIDVQYEDVDRMIGVLLAYKKRVEHYRSVLRTDLDTSSAPEEVQLRCPYTGHTAEEAEEEREE